MPNKTLLIRAAMFLFLGCNQWRALDMEFIALFIRNQAMIIYHSWHGHPQRKNKCLWDSSSCLQNTQVGSIGMNCNRSRVRSLPKAANHKMKLYLGKDHCSQTTLFHEIVAPTCLKNWYAWARKGPAFVDQLVINWILSLGLPLRRERRSRTERMDFHNGEECWLGWAVQISSWLK